MDDTEFRRRYGPWALVAGASVGMGEQFSRQIAARGLNLVLVARRSEPLDDLAAELAGRHGVEVRPVAADLAAPDLWDRLAPVVEDIEVGLLVCNAATYAIGEFLDSGLDAKLRELDLNCRSPLILTYHLGSRMAARGRGGILIVSSMSGFQGSAMVSSYAATKAYDTVLAEGLWEELRHRGVDVLAFVAGSTRTPNFEANTPRPATGLAAPMEPADVVRQALAEIDRGPTRIAGPTNAAGAFFMQRLLPRRTAVEFISRTTRRIYGADPDDGGRSGEGGWDETYDVVVVGFGAAGACAALQAAEDGARVLVVDRFSGGGATKLSGGIVYAGGGTAQQRAAGFDDDVDAMEAYLRTEAGDAVDAATLREFCTQSLDNLAWLQARGVGFPLPFHEAKTTQPPDGYGLYFSGNEMQRAATATPAPRGHRVDGSGMTGKDLYAALASAVRDSGATVWTHTEALHLVTDGTGAVVGVELRRLPDDERLRRRHGVLAQAAAGLAQARSPMAAAARRRLHAFEERHGSSIRVRAGGGIVLCSGGFSFDREAMARHTGPYAAAMPLGTAGDDGAALRLGAEVGAATGELERCAASRFICPPEAFVAGALVNAAGQRFCDESLYGATVSSEIARQPGARAWLVIDDGLWHRARAEMAQEERLRDQAPARLLSGEMNYLVFRKATAWLNLRVNRKKAGSVSELARMCGIDAGGLAETVAGYTEAVASGAPDAFGKAAELRAPLDTPPYYAIGCDLGSRLFPAPCLTLGGLAVEGSTGRVRRGNGDTIQGLYAAGRAAVGVSSRSYVSGLSLADCVFSGRNAGRDAAAVARHALTQ